MKTLKEALFIALLVNAMGWGFIWLDGLAWTR